MRLISPRGKQISSKAIIMKSIGLYLIYLKAFPQPTICINWVSIQSRAFTLYAEMSFVFNFLFEWICSDFSIWLLQWTFKGTPAFQLPFVSAVVFHGFTSERSKYCETLFSFTHLRGRVECSAVFLSAREQNSLSHEPLVIEVSGKTLIFYYYF